jgi:hypothetical protein
MGITKDIKELKYKPSRDGPQFLTDNHSYTPSLVIVAIMCYSDQKASCGPSTSLYFQDTYLAEAVNDYVVVQPKSLTSLIGKVLEQEVVLRTRPQKTGVVGFVRPKREVSMYALELYPDVWELGTAYINAPHHQFEPTEKARIRAFVEERWQADIVATGIRVCFVPFQPYRSAKQMSAAVQATGELLISTLGNVQADDPHPLTPELNLKYRAVHDLYHCILGAGFSAPGEITASGHSIKLARDTGYPMFVQQFLFSDVVGQAGHFYVTGGQYANQKVVLFPPALIDELAELYEKLGATDLIAYLTPIDQAARERHGWKTRSAH